MTHEPREPDAFDTSDAVTRAERPTVARQRLPNRRAAEVRTFEFSGHKFTATIGRFCDGSPAESFLNTAKTGSELDRSTRDGAILASLSLQMRCSCRYVVSCLDHATCNHNL
jgi:hypothetical protein